MNLSIKFCWRAGVLLLIAVALSPAAVPAGDISYADIAPILRKSCYKCHDSGEQKAKLRLDSYQAIMKGSEKGDVVVPGKPERSSLYQVITLPLQAEGIMPPTGQPLRSRDIRKIKKWILAGAKKSAKTGLVANSGAGEQ